MTKNYTASMDYEHIEVALKSFWDPFNNLLEEMGSFVPLSISDFAEERERWSENIRKLNPEISNDELNRYAESQFDSSRSPEWQYFAKFSDRVMTMYVTVTLLSQALCEAQINAILAVGLHENGLVDQFSRIERADIRTKWIEHPKIFCPNYELKKDSELYITLNRLIGERNAWMHHKIYLSVDDKKILDGSKLNRASYQENMNWLKRYFSLPFDLAAHAHSFTQQPIAVMMFFKRKPIPVAEAHK